MTLNKVILGGSLKKWPGKYSKEIFDLKRRSISSFVKYTNSHSNSLPNFNVIDDRASGFKSTTARFYVNVGKEWLAKRNQYTKYRITKPWTSDTSYDDIFLSEPSKDDFSPFTKDMPVFLKFLNLLTKAQNRKEVFVDFVKRCENGLVVEKDVYITKEELLECMWANGYSEEEMNAFKFGFPNDYKFHYPELAVLFELEEEECYKFCLRERAGNPEELVELKLKKPKNLVSSYGLVFLGCWFALSNAVLGNAWFFAKTLPFGAVFYLLASYFQKWLKEYFWKEENAMIEKVKQEKDYCEEAIYSQLRKYLEDSKAVEYVESFKAEVVKTMELYKKALLLKMREDATNLMKERLNNMAMQEAAIASSLEKNMVKELVGLFLETLSKNEKLKEEALVSAVNEIRGEYDKSKDPMFTFFNSNLEEFQTNKTESSFVSRCNSLFDQKEKEFLDTFTVTNEEYEEVAKLAKSCKTKDGFNLRMLTEEQKSRLEKLYENLSHKMGYYVPEVPSVVGDFVDKEVNTELLSQVETVKNLRLEQFLSQFA